VPSADRDLVEANDPRPWHAHTAELLAHVLHLEGFDRLPIQVRFPRDILDRRRAAPAADPEGESLRVEWIVGEKVQALLLHRPAVPTGDPSPLDRHVNPVRATREIARPMRVAIVPRAMQQATRAAARFFERRVSGTTRAGDHRKSR